MKRKTKFAVILLPIVFLGFVGVLSVFQRGWFSGEPVAAGRSLTSWLNRITCFSHQKDRFDDLVPAKENPIEDKRHRFHGSQINPSLGSFPH